VRDEGGEGVVLGIVHDNASTSTSHISSAIEHSQSAKWSILREDQAYSFQAQPVQVLQSSDKRHCQ
jgi:hypothetical protein